MKELLSPKAYFMGRDTQPEYKDECTVEIKANADNLCKRVNNLLNELWHVPITVSSGWRPASINSKIPNAAKKSLHMEGKAVDIADPDGKLAAIILKNVEEKHKSSDDVLNKYGLWLENPTATKGWVHLDMSVARSPRTRRVFNP